MDEDIYPTSSMKSIINKKEVIMGGKRKIKKIPKWFNTKASENDKMFFRQALANYVAFDLPEDAPKL